MTFFLGSAFSIHIENPAGSGLYEAIECTESAVLTINNEEIDVSAKCNSPWKHLMEGGAQSISVSFNGLISYGDMLRAVLIAAHNGTGINAMVISEALDSYTCKFLITSCKRNGDNNGAERVSLTLQGMNTPIYSVISNLGDYGWVQSPNTGWWYKISDSDKLVDDARAEALTYGAYAAYLDSVEECLFVSAAMVLGARRLIAWIGLIDLDPTIVWDFHWHSGEPYSLSTSNWLAGEPYNTAGIIVRGVAMYLDGSGVPYAGYWTMVRDTTVYQVIMQIKDPATLTPANWAKIKLTYYGWVQSPNTGYWYRLTNAQQGWVAGEAIAVQCGSHLASIHSSAENTWIFSTYQVATAVKGWMWVGGHNIVDASNASWSDGSAWDYWNWAAGQPNNASPTQHFLEYNFLLSGWADTEDSYNSWGLMQIKDPATLTPANWDAIEAMGAP